DTVVLPSNQGCGSEDHPCTYDGTGNANTGILCRTFCPNANYFFKIDVASVPAGGLTLNYVCLLHGPTMSGSFQIVPADAEASSKAELKRDSRAQYAPQNAQGFAAKSAALQQARTTGTVQAGTEDPSGHVQV